MNRRAWLIAGMLVTTPCLVFSCLLSVLLLHVLLLAAFGWEWRVENRTAERIWVTPMAARGPDPVPLPAYASRLASYSSPPFGEVLIQPGERRRLVIDGHAAADVGGNPIVVVRTAEGDHRYCEGTYDAGTVRYAIDDLSLLPRASHEMIAAVTQPSRPMLLGIPFWVIAFLGLAAPIALFRLRRSYRKQKQTP